MRSALGLVAAVGTLLLCAPVVGAQPSYAARCGTGVPSSEVGYVPLPRGDVFCPLVADPKSNRSFGSYLEERAHGAPSDSAIDILSVGIGDVFGLARWTGRAPGEGVQLSLMAGVFAQFDLGTSSYDLLNADYVVGLPLTMRRGWYSMRLRLYHQSSHLGDEYLLREPPDRRDRENLSFESFEAIFSADAGALRGYAGGEVLFRREPEDLERWIAHGGLEWRPWFYLIPLGSLGGFRFVGAGDLKASGEHDWKPAVSVRAGLEYDRAGTADPPARRWGLFFQYYTGPSPYGQFFRENVRHLGVGVLFGGL